MTDEHAAKQDATAGTGIDTTVPHSARIFGDDYPGNVPRIITGTLDECVRRGVIPAHA